MRVQLSISDKKKETEDDDTLPQPVACYFIYFIIFFLYKRDNFLVL